MLTENEWNTINNMLLELYTIDELDVFTSKIMKMIRMLIPYTKGSSNTHTISLSPQTSAIC